MEGRWCIVLLLSLSALADVWGPVKFNSNNAEYYSFSFSVPILSSGLNINSIVPSECPYQLCLTYLIGVPNNTLSSWPVLCKLYRHLATELFTFFNQPGVYQGIVYLPRGSPGNCSVDISFSGESCKSGFGTDCLTPLSLPLTTPLDPASEIYFQVTAMASNIQSFNVVANVSNDQDGMLLLSYREGDIPRSGVVDNSSATDQVEVELNLVLPRETNHPEFSKLFSLHNNGLNSVSVSIIATQVSCRAPYYGDECQFEVVSCDRGKTYIVDPSFLTKGWYYCSVNFSKVGYFSIGVASIDASFSPQLYVRLGSIPSMFQFDAVSNDSTKDPRFYFSGQNVPTDVLWFVGVYGASTPFGLWFEDDCPSECSGTGRCENHQCFCADGWTSFDCSVKTSDEGQTKIGNNMFLVIGAIAAVIVLGVIIFLYYRYQVKPRKTKGYEYLGSHTAPDVPKDRSYDSLTIGSL